MKCIYWANESYQIRNSDGVMVTLNNGDIVDIPRIPNDKVSQLFPHTEPVAPVETPKKKKAPKKASKKSK
tara:strand:- start:38245 stop:38454 length:210 start_codon:yes stop_codon:yes gene_type:complete